SARLKRPTRRPIDTGSKTRRAWIARGLRMDCARITSLPSVGYVAGSDLDPPPARPDPSRAARLGGSLPRLRSMWLRPKSCSAASKLCGGHRIAARTWRRAGATGAREVTISRAGAAGGREVTVSHVGAAGAREGTASRAGAAGARGVTVSRDGATGGREATASRAGAAGAWEVTVSRVGAAG